MSTPVKAPGQTLDDGSTIGLARPVIDTTTTTATTTTTSSGGEPHPASIESDTKSGSSSSPASKRTAPVASEIKGFRFWSIFISLLCCVFLFALDQLIVATAIPKITEAFNALSQLPWITSGFFLPLFGLNLIYSQLLGIFPSKHVIMFAVFVFEVGSLICGVAPSMTVLILGRAIAGAGAAGIFSGGMVVIAEITSLHNRAQYIALFGVVFALASVLGPLIGGAFSDHVSWRWCFYINLPLGGVALVSLGFFQPTWPPLGRAKTYQGYGKHMLRQVLRCDWVAATIAMAFACVFILGLQWGGVTKKWSDPSVIVCLVFTGVLIPVFLLWEWWIGSDRAMFSLAIVKRRTVIGASGVLCFLFASMMFSIVYISFSLQAVYNFSATSAGIRLLPMIGAQMVALIGSSRIIPKVHRFKWAIVSGPVFMALGSGLLYTVQYGTSVGHIYGFEVILGFGVGLALQNTMLSIQYDLRSQPQNIAIGTGIGTFIGFFGRILGVSLAGSVFENMVQVNLRKHVPGISDQLIQVVVSDASAVWKVVPDAIRPQVLTGYIDTLRLVFILGVPMAVLAFGFALLIRNSKMPTKAEEEAEKAARAAREAEAEAAAAPGEKKAAEAGGVGGGGDGVVHDELAHHDDGEKISDIEASPKAADAGRFAA